MEVIGTINHPELADDIPFDYDSVIVSSGTLGDIYPLWLISEALASFSVSLQNCMTVVKFRLFDEQPFQMKLSTFKEYSQLTAASFDPDTSTGILVSPMMLMPSMIGLFDGAKGDVVVGCYKSIPDRVKVHATTEFIDQWWKFCWDAIVTLFPLFHEGVFWATCISFQSHADFSNSIYGDTSKLTYNQFIQLRSSATT